MTPPPYDHTLTFTQAYSESVITGSGTPDANDTVFHNLVQARLEYMISVISGRPGVRNMASRLTYNTLIYRICLVYTVG